jgi:Skp family chaperone for outer membrane proteins
MFKIGFLVALCYVTGVSFAEEKITVTQSLEVAKMAVVDIQYILDNSLAIKDLRDKIELITKELHAEMTKKELDLKKDEEDLVRLKGTISANESEKKANVFNSKVSEAQKYAQKQKIKLEKAHSEGMLQVHNETIKIIQELCRKRGYNIVIPSSQLLYADSSLNISQEVLEMLNKKISSIKINL